LAHCRTISPYLELVLHERLLKIREKWLVEPDFLYIFGCQEQAAAALSSFL